MNDARLLVDELAEQVSECRHQWRAVAGWSASHAAYLASLARAGKVKARAPASPAPGGPSGRRRAPAAAFGIAIPASRAGDPDLDAAAGGG